MSIPKLWLCPNCETLQPITQLTCEVCGESIPVECLLYFKKSSDIINDGEEYPFVDLGLSVLWAKYNLGAMKESEHGDYLTWNDIHDNSLFSVCSTEMCKIDIFNYYKNQKVLLSSRFPDIRMPSLQDFTELIRYCRWEKTVVDGINGYKITGKNGNHIFLPISGHKKNGDVTSINCYGQYLSSSYQNDNIAHYLLLRFMQDEHYIFRFHDARTTGRTIRPVIDRDCYKPIKIDKAPESIAKEEFVDLGLSVKWALCNLGANKPEEFGDYYAWGALTPKTDSPYSNISYIKLNNMNVTKDNNLTPENDVVTRSLGNGVRLPTRKEIEEFETKCSFTWTILNGIWGCNCKGPNGNSIFLPAAGCFSNGKIKDNIEFVRIWSSTISTNDSDAYGLGIRKSDNHSYVFGAGKRNEMHPIRPVQDY